MTATIPSPATVPHKPWRSGFCNPDHDAESHRRCSGHDDTRPCRCECHIAERLLELADQIEHCADLVIATDLTGVDPAAAVHVDKMLGLARRKVSSAQEHVCAHIGRAWSGSWKTRLAVPGVGSVRPYKNKKTQWRDDDVAAEVVARHMRTLGGVVPDPMAVVAWIKDAAAINYWRVGVLEQLGINPDDFRDTEYGNTRLSVDGNRDKPKETDQ